MLCGLALVPTDDVQKDILSFRANNSYAISGPDLGYKHNIPHLSILQCPFRPKALTVDVIEEILNSVGTTNITPGYFTHLTYQPKAWIFAHVTHDTYLDDMQNAAMQVLHSAIQTQEIKLDKDFSGYSKRQVAYYTQYGYRYLREEFVPHITIGRTVNHQEYVTPELTQSFAVELAGREITYDRLAFYRAGPSGVFAQELASIALN